jgi:hypothetical protein
MAPTVPRRGDVICAEGVDGAGSLSNLTQNAVEIWRGSYNDDRRAILEAVCLNRDVGSRSLELIKKQPFGENAEGLFLKRSRGDRIRTCDFLLPKQALYQAELRPE